jgi:hypothetical protein
LRALIFIVLSSFSSYGTIPRTAHSMIDGGSVQRSSAISGADAALTNPLARVFPAVENGRFCLGAQGGQMAQIARKLKQSSPLWIASAVGYSARIRIRD